MIDFNHLHLHTIFSTLDGVGRLEEYADKCVEYNMGAFAVTDHGSMAGIPDGFFASQKKKVKMIPGIEFYYSDFYKNIKELLDSKKLTLARLKESSPELSERFRRNRHLTVLAKNMSGWSNMLKISHESWEKYFYYKPRTNLDLFRDNKDGLIILSGCLNGPVCHELRWAVEASDPNKTREWLNSPEHYIKKASRYVERFLEIFGDDFYFEFQILDPSIPYAVETYKLLYDLWKTKYPFIKPVITNDVHYIDQKDFDIQLTMMAVSQGLTIDDPDLFHTNTDEQYFKTGEQILQSCYNFGYDFMSDDDIVDMLNNTLLVSDKCDVFNPDLSVKLPDFEDANDSLRQQTVDKLKKLGLYQKDNKHYIDGRSMTYLEQLNLELERIMGKGFASYFLIVSDVIKYYRELEYEMGPGRGSAAGSLVCFLLGITEIDPILAGLSFDRFLSQSRGGNALAITMD